MVQIALADGDLAAAWQACDRFGPGHAWRQLADASRATHPAAAAELYRPHIEDLLPQANTRNYPEIASLLARMRDLHAAAEDYETVTAYVDEIRLRYPRRTSLHSALRRQGF